MDLHDISVLNDVVLRGVLAVEPARPPQTDVT
jgi:hypothetical protein